MNEIYLKNPFCGYPIEFIIATYLKKKIVKDIYFQKGYSIAVCVFFFFMSLDLDSNDPTRPAWCHRYSLFGQFF